MTSITALAQAAPVDISPGPKPEAAGPSSTQSAPQQSSADTPKFVSPVMNVDAGTGVAVLEYRDGSTGKEIAQIPTRQAIQEYARHKQENSVGAAKTPEKS